MRPLGLRGLAAGMVTACVGPVPQPHTDPQRSDTALLRDTGTLSTVVDIVDGENVVLDVSLEVELTRLTSGADAALGWASLTEDVLGRPLTACEQVDTVRLYRFDGVSERALLDGLSQDRLSADPSAIWSCEPTACGCQLSDFSFVGHPMFPSSHFVDDGSLWMLVLAESSPARRVGLALLAPDADVVADVVDVSDRSTQLQARAKLTVLAAGEGAALRVDWSQLTVDGWGNPLDHQQLDTFTLDRVEADARDVELLSLAAASSERWTLAKAGATSVVLSEMVGERLFPGVDGDSSWVFTAGCSTCSLDLPRVAVLLAPED